MEKQGPGKLILAGTNANSYSGDTTIADGVLVLNKPDGVRATTNITLRNGNLRWGASEQVPDGAMVKIGGFFNGADLMGKTETITHLGLGYYCGIGSLASGGQLKLLGDIFQADDFYFSGSVSCPLLLGPGAHRIYTTNSPLGEMNFNGDVRDLTTNGGLSFSNMTVTMVGYATNTFTGPVDLQASTLTIFNRYSLGSPVQGVTMDQGSALYLNLPDGHVITGESLTNYYNPGNPSFGNGTFGSQSGFFATNGWSGPIVLNNDLNLVGPADWSLNLSGPISGFGNLNSYLTDNVFLTGNTPNNFGVLNVRSGRAHLAKSPGVQAAPGSIYVMTLSNTAPEIHFYAPGQVPTNTLLQLNGAGVYLHDNPITVRTLYVVTDYSYVNCGTNPASSLTIRDDNNLVPFFGDFNGTLIKQGAGAVSFSGNFQNGDLFVQGGVFNRTAGGVVGQTVISPGAVVNSSGPQIFNFGALSGAGTLNISGVNTWVGGTGNASTFTGSIIGTTAGTTLTKLGSGTLTLAGPVTLASTLFVQHGTLLVNTTISSPIQVTPLAPGTSATLGGIGTLGNVIVTGTGARLAPGATTSVPSCGKLTVTNLALDGGALYLCELGGTNAGVNLDQIDVKDTTTLLNCGANFTAFGGGVVSNRYAVLKSASAVNGIFSGKSEGSIFFPSAGRMMNITYVGGASGRDIVLMDLSAIPPGSFSGIQVLTNGAVQVGGTGTPGVLYEAQANANLNTTNWILIGTATGNFNGAFSFIDTNAPGFPMRFYRFVQP